MNFSTECDTVRVCTESWTYRRDSWGNFLSPGCAIALEEKAKEAANSSCRRGRWLGTHPSQQNTFGKIMLNSGLLLAGKQSCLAWSAENINNNSIIIIINITQSFISHKLLCAARGCLTGRSQSCPELSEDYKSITFCWNKALFQTQRLVND